MDPEDDYDELYDEDEAVVDPDDFNLGPCLAAPIAKLYTTKQLHSMWTQQRVSRVEGKGRGRF